MVGKVTGYKLLTNKIGYKILQIVHHMYIIIGEHQQLCKLFILAIF